MSVQFQFQHTVEFCFYFSPRFSLPAHQDFQQLLSSAFPFGHILLFLYFLHSRTIQVLKQSFCNTLHSHVQQDILYMKFKLSHCGFFLALECKLKIYILKTGNSRLHPCPCRCKPDSRFLGDFFSVFFSFLIFIPPLISAMRILPFKLAGQIQIWQ